jgi:SsrA-binding protein
MQKTTLSINRKIENEYEINWSVEAGLSLSGYQVKSIRGGHANITNAYGYLDGRSVFIKNLFSSKEHESVRLLLNKSEIKRIIGLYSHDKRVIVFRELYDKKGKIKLELCVGERFTKHDHRRKLIEKDIRRQSKYEW